MAVEDDNTLSYLMEVVKKRKEANKGCSLTASINASRKLTEKGMKKNEVAKAAHNSKSQV